MMLVNEKGLLVLCEKTFIDDATHICKKAPLNIQQCSSVFDGKKAVTAFVQNADSKLFCV